MPVAPDTQNALPALRRLIVSLGFLRAADGSPLNTPRNFKP